MAHGWRRSARESSTWSSIPGSSAPTTRCADAALPGTCGCGSSARRAPATRWPWPSARGSRSLRAAPQRSSCRSSRPSRLRTGPPPGRVADTSGRSPPSSRRWWRPRSGARSRPWSTLSASHGGPSAWPGASVSPRARPTPSLWPRSCMTSARSPWGCRSVKTEARAPIPPRSTRPSPANCSGVFLVLRGRHVISERRRNGTTAADPPITWRERPSLSPRGSSPSRTRTTWRSNMVPALLPTATSRRSHASAVAPERSSTPGSLRRWKLWSAPTSPEPPRWGHPGRHPPTWADCS